MCRKQKAAYYNASSTHCHSPFCLIAHDSNLLAWTCRFRSKILRRDAIWTSVRL